MPLPILPPPYTLALIERDRDPFEHARARARARVEDGLLLLADRTDRLAMALLLEPDRPRASTLEALYLLANAAADTLAARLPPLLPVHHRWPGGLLVDGAEVGRLRVAVAPGPAEAPPAWLVLGLEIRVAASVEEPGQIPDRTCLAELGCGEASPGELVEAVSRHFLTWLERFEQDGPGPVHATWNARCHERGRRVTLALAGRSWIGTLRGIDGEGALVIGEARLPLEAASEALA